MSDANGKQLPSRKWIAVKLAMWIHIPVIVSGVVALFMAKDGASTVTLGALGSLVALVAAYAGINVAQKRIQQ